MQYWVLRAVLGLNVGPLGKVLRPALLTNVYPVPRPACSEPRPSLIFRRWVSCDYISGLKYTYSKLTRHNIMVSSAVYD